MGTFATYRNPKALDQYAQLADSLGLARNNQNLTKEEKVQALINAIESLKAKVGCPNAIRDVLSISREEFEATASDMALSAFDDQCTGCNPRYPLVQELKQIFMDTFDGTPVEMQSESLRAHL